MTKESDSIQNLGNGQFGDFTTTLQAIFAEGADYTEKSVESRLALGEKLLGASRSRPYSDPDGICQDGIRRLRRAGD